MPKLMLILAVTYGGVGKPLAVNMMQDPNRLGRAQLVCDYPRRHNTSYLTGSP